MNLSYGSRGDSVRDLQRQLNQRGYKLDEDGVFGNNTLAAVKDYQRKNGLDVDGIVGSKTAGSLRGASAGLNPVNPGVSTQGVSTTQGRRSGVSDSTASALAGYEKGYTPSPTVKAAEQYLKQVQGQKPGEYQSPYAEQLSAMYDQIVGRDPFTYNLNEDMLYRQYRDQYQNLGQQAMMDTMGQAAGLTGGYGSSYSQNAGQQAYQGYLQQLNDKVPDLYRLALDKYNAEGDEMYRRYGLLNDRENTAYGRYRDQVSDWSDEYARAYGRYGDERNFDYGKWGDMLSYWRDKANNENDEWWKQTQFDYQKQRDAIADAQWERQFAAAQAARYSGGGGGGSNGGRSGSSGKSGGSGVTKPNSMQEVPINGNQYKVNAKYEVPGYGTVNGQQLYDLWKRGVIDVDSNGVIIPRKKPITGPFNMIQ